MEFDDVVVCLHLEKDWVSKHRRMVVPFLWMIHSENIFVWVKLEGAMAQRRATSTTGTLVWPFVPLLSIYLWLCALQVVSAKFTKLFRRLFSWAIHRFRGPSLQSYFIHRFFWAMFTKLFHTQVVWAKFTKLFRRLVSSAKFTKVVNTGFVGGQVYKAMSYTGFVGQVYKAIS